jgi:hypothetical protein
VWQRYRAPILSYVTAVSMLSRLSKVTLVLTFSQILLLKKLVGIQTFNKAIISLMNNYIIIEEFT